MKCFYFRCSRMLHLASFQLFFSTMLLQKSGPTATNMILMPERHVHWLGVCCRMAEGLHHQVSLETEAGQVLQLITRHGACGVLGANRPHSRLAVGSWYHTVHAAGLSHHLLCQGESLHIHLWLGHLLESGGRSQAHALTSPVGETTTNNQRNTATSSDLTSRICSSHIAQKSVNR